MISRHDLIAAGGSFYVERFKHNPEAKGGWGAATDGHLVHVMVDRPSRGSAYVTSITTMGRDNVNFNRGPTEDAGTTSIVDRREALAKFVEKGDPEAASALRILSKAPEEATRPWETLGPMPLLTKEQIQASGLNVDALLYVSTQAHSPPSQSPSTDPRINEAAAHYIRLGADPLARTPDGDCAARAGVARGLDAFMTPQWVNAKDLRTGETGLHELARTDKEEGLRKAISVGGRMDEKDDRGRDVYQTLKHPTPERIELLMELSMHAYAQASHEGLQRELGDEQAQEQAVARPRRRM